VLGRILFCRMCTEAATEMRRLFGCVDIDWHARYFVEGVDRVLTALVSGDDVDNIPLMHHLARANAAAGVTDQDYQLVILLSVFV